MTSASLLAPGALEAFGLYLLRTSALVLSSPILGDSSGFSGYKISLIVVLAVVAFSVGGAPIAGDLDAIAYLPMALREVLLGVFLGFSLALAFVAVRVGGELISHEMVMTIAREIDPTTGVATPVVTRIYEVLFLLGFLAIDGHHWIVQSLVASFEHAPVGALAFDGGLVDLFRSLFGAMFRAGLVFAAPVMVLLFLTSILIGLLSRAVPHLNVLEASFSIRILLGIVAMLVFAPLVAPAMASLYEAFAAWLELAIEEMGG